MTGLIDTLEKDGLVVRSADSHDRRTTHVHLTPQGEAFVESMLPNYFQSVSEIIKPLSETERKLLVDLLLKLQEGLTKPEEAFSPEPAPIAATF